MFKVPHAATIIYVHFFLKKGRKWLGKIKYLFPIMRFSSSKEQAAKDKRTGVILVCSYCPLGFHRLG
jgi:hypothetical protein